MAILSREQVKLQKNCDHIASCVGCISENICTDFERNAIDTIEHLYTELDKVTQERDKLKKVIRLFEKQSGILDFKERFTKALETYNEREDKQSEHKEV